MSKLIPKLFTVALLFAMWTFPTTVSATVITSGTASATTGPVSCRSGYPIPNCNYQAYNTANNLAYGATATASSTLSGYSTIHDISFINDGFYGNAASWIAGTANSWIEIDLGFDHDISQIIFGRDRLDGFNDRDPGHFQVEVALAADHIFNNVVNSSLLGFSGVITGAESILVDFNTGPVTARYLRMTFANNGTAIDEIEVFGTLVPEPATLALLGLGLAGVGFRRKRTKML
jgi:hypothetical protein